MKPDNDNVRIFVRMLSKYQGQIYSYILSLVGNCSDADDILQDTSSKMWEMFDIYEPGTDFLKWSLSVAYYRVLEYRRKNKYHKSLIYDDDFFIHLSESAPSRLSQTSKRLEKLKDCIDKLDQNETSLLAMKYNKCVPVKEIATRINKSIRTVYYSLARIQHRLLLCIEKT